MMEEKAALAKENQEIKEQLESGKIKNAEMQIEQI